MLFVSEEEKLYLGTANPFQGCEVWVKKKPIEQPGNTARILYNFFPKNPTDQGRHSTNCLPNP
jgi:hypothetical protein